MSIHVHRNSFNAGEISPLMDARVDENKHQFSCRILENFIPKIYGGAFRRPGTVYTGTAHNLSVWTERTESERVLFPDASAPTVNDDAPVYEVGSLWLRNVKTLYNATAVGAGAATWATVSGTHNLYAYEAPGATDDTNAGYAANSVWIDNGTGALYVCTSASAGAATWALSGAVNNLDAVVVPIASDDTGDGYTAGSTTARSYWVTNARTLYECSDATGGAAVWGIVGTLHNLASTDVPGTGDDSDDGYTTDSYWIRNAATVYKAASVGVGTASWNTVSATHKLDATRPPTKHDDTNDLYTTSSVWLDQSTGVLYRCTSATAGNATWVSLNNPLAAGRLPKGADTGFATGTIWAWPDKGRVWELTGTTGQQAVRLFDFNVSATTRYVLEMGDGYLRIWNDDASRFLDELTSPYTEPLQLTIPYAAADLFEVQIAQLGNLAYFAHPNYPPQKLERSFNASFGAATFTWSEVDWSFPAFRDTNTTEVTATPSAATGTPVTISFSANPFTETLDYSKYIGARIMLSQRRDDAQVKRSLTSTGTSAAVNVLGTFRVYTYGAAKGTLDVQGKDKAGNWRNLKTFEFNAESGGRNIVYQSETTEATDIRLNFTALSGSTGDAYLEAEDSRRIGYARIWNGIPFNNSLPVVPCEVELAFDSTDATTEWAIEAWAEYAGYPRSVCFHEQRLWFGGTELQPNTLWASAVGDYENFRRGSFDSDSLAFTLAAQEGSAIQSLVSHDALVIFTQSEEWTATTSQDTAITPSNIFVRRQSRFGSAHKQAFVAANNLLFLQRGSRKLRQFSYGKGGDGVASDLTLLAEHVTLTGIRQIAFQQQPDPIIWCVRNDGVLLSLTYEADQEVIAWARHTSGDGLFESVATIYGDDGEADEVWVVVNRGGTRLVERIDSEAYTKLEEDDAARMIYLDSAVLVERDPASTSVTGLSHLEGETVNILADGAVVPSKTVASGSITLETAAETVVVGIPYTSKLQPSKIEIAMQDGTAQGRRFICKRAALNLWKTFGLQYSDDPDASENQWFDVEGRSTNTTYDTASPLTTGMRQINNLGRHGDSIELCFRQTLPLPANLLAIVPKLDVAGN